VTFGPGVGNVGMYVAREMLAAVPEDQRDAYLRMVEGISELKYQLGVEVARQLPRLLAQSDPDLIARYLNQVSEVAKLGWKSGVEVAKQLPDLYEAPDPELANSYVDIIEHATGGTGAGAETSEMADELAQLEREIAEMEPKVKRAQELRTELAAVDRRDEKRKKHAVELATALPPLLARLRPKHRPVYLEEVQRIAGADPEASLEAADTLLDLLNSERISHDGATEWVDRGLDVLERNKEVGRGYFRLGSKFSLEVLEELREGLALKSVARILKLYATALSGRDIAIRSTEDANSLEIYTADHIVLPADMRVFDEERQNFAAYKVATAQGAGRIEFGTYLFSLDEISDTVESIRAKYWN
jgi:hypothetical protein